MINWYKLGGMLLILFCFSCRKKIEYETFQFNGLCYDWFHGTPLSGVKIKLYSGYRAGGWGILSSSGSELVGETITNTDGTYNIVPRKSRFETYSDAYILVKMEIPNGYYPVDSYYVKKRVDIRNNSTFQYDFIVGKMAYLKILINTDPALGAETLTRVGVNYYNDSLDFSYHRFLKSYPVMEKDFGGGEYFVGPLNDGYMIFEVFANDSTLVSGTRRTPPGIWEPLPQFKVYCPEGDTVIVNYNY